MAAVEAALFDDLNAPNALAALFTFITRANAEFDRKGDGCGGAGAARARRSRGSTAVLDIVPDRGVDDPELAAWVEERLAARRRRASGAILPRRTGFAPGWRRGG